MKFGQIKYITIEKKLSKYSIKNGLEASFSHFYVYKELEVQSILGK